MAEHRSCWAGDCHNTFVVTHDDTHETMCPRCRLLVARAERDVARRGWCWELAEWDALRPEVVLNELTGDRLQDAKRVWARENAEGKWGKDVALTLFPLMKEEV